MLKEIITHLEKKNLLKLASEVKEIFNEWNFVDGEGIFHGQEAKEVLKKLSHAWHRLCLIE